MVKEIILVFLLVLIQGAIFDPKLSISDSFTFPVPFQKDSLSLLDPSALSIHECSHQKSQTRQEAIGCKDNHDMLKDITNQPGRFKACLDSVIQEFPLFQPSDVLQAQQSTLNSMQKHLRLKKKGTNEPEMLFKVIEQANNPPKVVLEQYLHTNGYSRQEIEQALAELVDRIPALEDHKLVEAWSSRKVQNGKASGQLTLKLKKDEDELLVYLSTYKGKSWIAIYGL